MLRTYSKKSTSRRFLVSLRIEEKGKEYTENPFLLKILVNAPIEYWYLCSPLFRNSYCRLNCFMLRVTQKTNVSNRSLESLGTRTFSQPSYSRTRLISRTTCIGCSTCSKTAYATHPEKQQPQNGKW